jgi:hypothetical protein
VHQLETVHRRLHCPCSSQAGPDFHRLPERGRSERASHLASINSSRLELSYFLGSAKPKNKAGLTSLSAPTPPIRLMVQVDDGMSRILDGADRTAGTPHLHRPRPVPLHIARPSTPPHAEVSQRSMSSPGPKPGPVRGATCTTCWGGSELAQCCRGEAQAACLATHPACRRPLTSVCRPWQKPGKIFCPAI